MDFTQAKEWISKELSNSTEFWLKHGLDSEYGGMLTCLTREGEVYSTDKSVWMQGRAAWTYAYLCSQYGVKEEWLVASKSCLDFLEQYCRNDKANNRLYFTVTREGKPLRQRRYNFSEGFYCIANAEYYGVTGEQEYLDRATWAYDLIYALNHGMPDPTNLGPKTIPETRQSIALANPMIFLNTSYIMRRVDPVNADKYNANIAETIELINLHHKPELKATLEAVAPDGSPQLDTTAGRIVNPGHAIECAWFLLEEANYKSDRSLHALGEEIFQFSVERGWDSEYGGLLYFTDVMNYPPESYEHDMKLWWPHTEALVASIMLYRDTKNEVYKEWFFKILAYCERYFSDPEFGEWLGYLRRDGKPTMPSAKGSTFKGPFHVPRALIYVDKILEELIKSE